MGEYSLELAVKRRPEPQRSVMDNFSMQSIPSLRGSTLTDSTQNSHAYKLGIRQMPKDCRIGGKLDNDKRMILCSILGSKVANVM